MARNGSGSMSLLSSFVSGTTISSTSMNADLTDIASEITNSVAKDGQTNITAPIKFFSGTVGAPGISWASDTDSGFYRIGGDNVGLALGGTKYFDFAATGLTVTGLVAATTMTVGGAAPYTVGGTDVAIADGGTGAGTATLAFNALSPVTTRGDLIVRGATNNQRLAIGAANAVLISDGTDATWTSGAASDTVAGLFEVAVQSEMEAASSTSVAVTPGRQHFHPGMAKAWAYITVSGGTPTATASYNVASVTDNGAGTFKVNFTTSMSSVNYCAVAQILRSSPGSNRVLSVYVTSLATDGVNVLTTEESVSAGGNVGAIDNVSFFLAVYGDI